MDLITKKEARAKGLKHFYTGEKCHVGHDSPRYTKTSQCVECRTLQYKFPGGKERKAKHAKKYRESDKGRRHRLLNNATRRAKARGLEINIGIEDIEIPEYCPIFHIRLEPGATEPYNLNSPSLDRIDNSKGYVKGNVAVISLKANKFKSNLSLVELKSLAESLLTYLSRSEK